MTIQDLRDNCVEIQGKCRYCCYDYKSNRRIEIAEQEAADLEMKYIYCENGTLYIEFEKEAS